MKRNWRSVLPAIGASLLMVTLTSCAHEPEPEVAPVVRELPPVLLVVPAPVPRPEPIKGHDARLLARDALTYGDANAARLLAARRAYGGVRDDYGTDLAPKP